jgi:hypothetical protein
MKINEGTADRVIRVVVGLGMLYPFFFDEGLLSYLSLIGAVPLITGIGGYCPLYKLAGITTIGFGRRDSAGHTGHASHA